MKRALGYKSPSYCSLATMSSESLISCFTTRNFPHKSDSPINRISPYLVSHLDRIIWIFSDDEVEIAILIFKGSQAHWLPLLCLITRRAVVSRHYISIGLLPSAPENKVSTSKMELTRVVRAGRPLPAKISRVHTRQLPA